MASTIPQSSRARVQTRSAPSRRRRRELADGQVGGQHRAGHDGHRADPPARHRAPPPGPAVQVVGDLFGHVVDHRGWRRASASPTTRSTAPSGTPASPRVASASSRVPSAVTRCRSVGGWPARRFAGQPERLRQQPADRFVGGHHDVHPPPAAGERHPGVATGR
nr:hypothetical protein [Fodinicola feengrottensis]